MVPCNFNYEETGVFFVQVSNARQYIHDSLYPQDEQNKQKSFHNPI